jgi:hypothetical protein
VCNWLLDFRDKEISSAGTYHFMVDDYHRAESISALHVSGFLLVHLQRQVYNFSRLEPLLKLVFVLAIL